MKKCWRSLSLFMIYLSFVCISSCTKNPVTTDPGEVGPVPARIIMDTSYGTDSKQKADIYLPSGRTSATKVIFLIHGGGWESGDKTDLNSYKSKISALWHQAAIVNINYRLTSTASIHHNEIMSDITAAVALIKNNKSNFIVSDTFFMLGASAGAHLAMLYTYAYNSGGNVKAVADFFGPAKLSDWDWYNSYNIWVGQSVKDVLTRYNNSAWNVPIYDANSPYSTATATSKPTIIFHGTVDLVVPLYQSQWLRARLNTLGVANEYYEYLDGHGFNDSNTSDALSKTVIFFKNHIN